MARQSVTRTTKLKQPPQKQKSKQPIFTTATALILTLNLILFLTLFLSSLNATYYYASRTHGELECLSAQFPQSSSSPNSTYNSQLILQNPEREMKKILERARREHCRYPCYSTFGKWVGDKGIGNQYWESNGCEKVHNFCKAPLMIGRVGVDVVVWKWFRESLDRGRSLVLWG